MDTPLALPKCCTDWRRTALISLLVFQACLDFAIFGYVGLTIKWCLTLDPECAPHAHPHIPSENYIQRPNNILSIIMVATILDFVEPFLLLVWYCRTKIRKQRDVGPSYPRVYGCLRYLFLFWSWLTLILIGMSLAACWALAQELMPPDLRPNREIGVRRATGEPCDLVCVPNADMEVWYAGRADPFSINGMPGCERWWDGEITPIYTGLFPYDLVNNRPPPAPPPQRPLLNMGIVELTYGLLGLDAVVKLTSYWLGYPIMIYEWTYQPVY